jgi:hypothetical protein
MLDLQTVQLFALTSHIIMLMGSLQSFTESPALKSSGSRSLRLAKI